MNKIFITLIFMLVSSFLFSADYHKSVFKKDQWGNTFLHKLAGNDLEPSVKDIAIFLKKGFNVNAQNDEKNTPLHLALINENFKIAEYLVKKGVPFREAHGVVGGLVAGCEAKSCKLGDVPIDEFKAACEAIEEDVYDSLGAGNVTWQYLSAGAAGPEQAAEEVIYWKEKLKKR